MTESQQNPQSTKSASRIRLEEQFSVDTVNAFAGLAREEATAVFDEKIEEIRELVAQQVATRRRVDELPIADQSAVAPQVNDANRQVAAVAQDANDIGARQRAGEPIDPREVAALEERAAQARESSDEATESVDRRLAAATRVREQHQATQPPQQEQPVTNGSTYATKDDLAGLRSEVDQLKAGQRETMVVSATAYAWAEASDNSDAIRRAGRFAAAAFVVTLLFYCLSLIGNDTWDWTWGIGLPAVVAGIVGMIVWAITADNDGPSSNSITAADAIVRRWQGEEDPWDDSNDKSVDSRQQPAHGSTASANANAQSR